MAAQACFGMAEDSRTTDSDLGGLFVLNLSGWLDLDRQLLTYLGDRLTWQENLTLECRGLRYMSKRQVCKGTDKLIT